MGVAAGAPAISRSRGLGTLLTSGWKPLPWQATMPAATGRWQQRTVARIRKPLPRAKTPALSTAPPRVPLSPQRGEGRGEGCDQPNGSLATRMLDSSPRPSPRSRRRGSASWAPRRIRLPATLWVLPAGCRLHALRPPRPRKTCRCPPRRCQHETQAGREPA
jgi:hypothetical protein